MKRIPLMVIVMFSTLICFAQNNKALDTSSVSEQFNYIIVNSPNNFDSKTIKLNLINQLKNNVLDTVSKLRSSQSSNVDLINAQKITLDSLKTEFETALTTFETLNTEKQNITFLGISFNKATFKSLSISIIVVLLLALAFYINKYKGSNAITEDYKQRLSDLEEEFDAHRKRALEREQITMRKLQDELNKQKKG